MAATSAQLWMAALLGVFLWALVLPPMGCAAASEDAVYKAATLCAGESPVGASGAAFVACLDRRVKAGPRVLPDRTFKELIRNFSCAQDDAGTPPLHVRQVAVPVGYDACEAASEAAGGAREGFPDQGGEVHPEFGYLPGVLPAGNDLGRERVLAAEAAAEHCAALPDCEGFTFSGNAPRGPAAVFFKTSAQGWRPDRSWHTYRRRRQEQSCPARYGQTSESRDLRTFDVDIVRERPLVAVVRKFANPEECKALVGAGGDWNMMGRAYTSGGAHSTSRRSYSSNIYPPLRDADDEITKLTALMFSVTRNLTGYNVYPAGQEPVNAVLYQFTGDEYRPHCDGACYGSAYRRGERVATSILYCRAAARGGQTSFTQDALKVVPREGDMLLFSYLLPGGRMAGPEVDHSGCPLRKGTKWIATQWYREGVSEAWNWEAANQGLSGWR